MKLQKPSRDFVTYKSSMYWDFSKKNKINTNNNSTSFIYNSRNLANEATDATLAAGYNYHTPDKSGRLTPQQERENKAYDRFYDAKLQELTNQYNSRNEAVEAEYKARASENKLKTTQNKLEDAKLQSQLAAENLKGMKQIETSKYGGKANQVTAKGLELLSGTDAWKRNTGLDKINSSNFKRHEEIIKKTVTLPDGSILLDPNGKAVKAETKVIVEPEQSALGYALSNHKSVVKTAADALTGYKGETEKSKKIAEKTKGLEGQLAQAYVNGDSNSKADKLQRKIDKNTEKEAEEIKSGRARAVVDTAQKVSNAGSVGLDAISSKHREQTVRESGLEGIKQKQAKLAYALGDRSFGTKVAAGKGFLGKLFNAKVNSNKKAYAKSLQYSGSFSEGEEKVEKGSVPFTWQPEEYAKMKVILDMDFESTDDKILAEKSDFSEDDLTKNIDEEKLKKILTMDFESKTETPDDEETDISIDYNNVDKDAVIDLLNTSFYKVKDREKKLQESIAKGFSQQASDEYVNFLEETSVLADSFNIG